MGITYLVYSNLVGDIAPHSNHDDHDCRLLCHGITRCDLRDCALIKQRVTGQIGGNAALRQRDRLLSYRLQPLPRGWKPTLFQMQGLSP